MEKNCNTCYKIVCQKCKWEPSEVEVGAINLGEITVCPICLHDPKS